VNLGPLAFIVAVSAIKDLFEDLARHKEDNKENNMPVRVGGEGKMQQALSRQIRVGNIVRVNKNEFFPCDMLLLYTSLEKGTCYIETKNLDGETNLKIKQCHRDIMPTFKSEADVSDTPLTTSV